MATIELRLKAIEDAIAELRDIQAISKLDIINLKNAIEQARLGIVPELPKVEKEEKAPPKLPKVKKAVERPAIPASEIMGLVSDIGELQIGLEELRDRIGAITIPRMPEVKDWSADIKRLNRDISRLATAVERLKAKKIRIPKPKISKALLQQRLKEITEKEISRSIKADISALSKRLAKTEKNFYLFDKRLSRLQKQVRI